LTDQGFTCATVPSHGAYVSCVAQAANDLSKADPATLPPECKGAGKKCAARSSCGKPGSVACYHTDEKGMTKCSVKPSGRCTDKPGATACARPGSCCDPCTP